MRLIRRKYDTENTLCHDKCHSVFFYCDTKKSVSKELFLVSKCIKNEITVLTAVFEA